MPTSPLQYGVPMLVNDNVSVTCKLPERVGLHIGQDDMPLEEARRLIGTQRILGVSVHTVENARQALASGIADYAGVGPVYGTLSKAGVTEDKVLGPRGASAIVDALYDPKSGKRIPCVLIGGVNQRTSGRALVGASGQHNKPDGIAVISAIVARTDPDVAASELRTIVDRFLLAPQPIAGRTQDEALQAAMGLLAHHRASSNGPPLIQTLTSHVSSTLSANIALAFSSSPIMSTQEAEAADLGKVTGGVVLNIGTISEESRRGMKAVGAAANMGGKPVVLDPVGVGASKFRKDCVQMILNETQVTLIKGNAAELSSIAGLSEVASRGVDSGAGSLSDPVGLVRKLARQEHCLVLLTGKTDCLSDGYNVVACDNGHPLVGRITGSGCALGVMLAAGMAAACSLPRVGVDANGNGQESTRKRQKTESSSGDPSRLSVLVNAAPRDLFTGALAALLSMTIASEKAAERSDVKGPGSFIPALIDEIASVEPDDLRQRAKIRIVQ